MDGVRVNWGDGVAAVDRTTRTIVLLVQGAIEQLQRLGYRRDRHIDIAVADDGLPIYVRVNGVNCYSVGFLPGSPTPLVVGNWEHVPPRRAFYIRWANALVRRFSRAGAA